MDTQTGANGRGPLGTGTNSPASDAGTLPRTQNRPNVTQGTALEPPGSGSGRSNLTESDREYLREIHRAKHLDGTPFRVDELLYLRGENARMQQEAIREFGPASKTVAWFNEVLAAYDEEIAKAKSPLGNSINDLKTVLADPKATEKEMHEKLVPMIKELHDDQVMGGHNEAAQEEGLRLISEVIDRVSEQRTTALEDLNKKEKLNPGSVSDEEHREAVITTMGGERQRQMMGGAEDEAGQKKSARAMQAVVEAMHLVSERRIKALKNLVDQEKKSGAVPEKTLKDLAVAVLGDERQNQMMGISDDKSGGLDAVLEVMRLIIKKRQAAINDLMRRQSVPGSGITNDQINQAIKDYDVLKDQARMLGIAAPDVTVTLGTPQIEQKQK